MAFFFVFQDLQDVEHVAVFMKGDWTVYENFNKKGK